MSFKHWYERDGSVTGWDDTRFEDFKKISKGGGELFLKQRDIESQKINPSAVGVFLDWLEFRLNQFKLSLAFTFKVLKDGRRGTHERGVEVVGNFKVREDINDVFPSNNLFKSGRNFTVKARFGQGAYNHDILNIARGFSVRLTSDDSEKDEHAFTANAGDGTIFWNQKSFWSIVKRTPLPTKTGINFDKRKPLFLISPQAWWGSIEANRSRVTSMTHLIYNTGTPFKFTGDDGISKYIKFQFFPSKENGAPENEGAFFPRKKEMIQPWQQTGGYDDGNRPDPNYLSQEIKSRLQDETINYELRAQLWDPSENDPHEVLSVNTQWQTKWTTLGEITIDNVVSDDVGKTFSFPIGVRSKTKVIDLPDLDNGWNGASKYVSLLYARQEIYDISIFVRKWRAKITKS